MRMVKKVIKGIIIAVIALVIIAIVGGSLVVGKMVQDGIFYQNNGNDTHDNSLKQLAIWNFDVEDFFASYTGVNFEIQSEDAVTVPGTYYELENCKGWVVLVHGAGGDRDSVIPVAKLLLKNGYSVITYDQRGCGENSSDKVSFGIFEKRDVKALVDYAKNDLGAKKVIVLGQSMGGMTTALYAATDHAHENVDAIILDSPIPSMEKMLMGVFMDDGTDEDTASYILECGRFYCKHFGKLDFADGETINEMKKNQCKTLVILSEQDELCLPEDVEALYNNIASDNKELVRLDCAHIEGAIDFPEEYEKSVIDFIED